MNDQLEALEGRLRSTLQQARSQRASEQGGPSEAIQVPPPPPFLTQALVGTCTFNCAAGPMVAPDPPLIAAC